MSVNTNVFPYFCQMSKMAFCNNYISKTGHGNVNRDLQNEKGHVKTFICFYDSNKSGKLLFLSLHRKLGDRKIKEWSSYSI